MSKKVELVETKDWIKQLEASKSSIKHLFSDILNETKGFKHQITLKVVLKKYKPNGETEFRPVYFNSTIKTVINHKFSLENAFKKILYRIDNWINEGSGWIVELIESQYINISTYTTWSGGSYVKLTVELRSPKKGLINIKITIKNVFYGVMLGILHGKIKIELPEREKFFSKIEKKQTIFALMCFVMKTNWLFQFTFQIKNLKTWWICCL